MNEQKINGSIFSDEDNSFMGDWAVGRKRYATKNTATNKTLAIKYLSCNVDDKNINLLFEISANNLTTNKATIYVGESEVFGTEEAVPKTIVTINPKGKQNITTSFSKDKSFSWSWLEGDFEFIATLTCDGLSAETNEFKIASKDIDSSKEDTCLCKKENWTAEDLNNIITQLRKMEDKHLEAQYDGKNPIYIDKAGKLYYGMNKKDAEKLGLEKYKVWKTFYDSEDGKGKKIEDRLFTKESEGYNIKDVQKKYSDFSMQLNATFSKYNINTCLRRLHFMAQIYHESQRLLSTYEQHPSSSVFGGDFYRGRGLKQITHDYNYLRYYDYVHKTKFYNAYMSHRSGTGESVTKFNERTENKYISTKDMDKFKEFVKLISTDLYYACDSAGWYWSINNINVYADKDDIISVSALVNNPSAKNTKSTDNINGFYERKKYYDMFKIIFNYENCK